eukprot:EG_transcript_22740
MPSPMPTSLLQVLYFLVALSCKYSRCLAPPSAGLYFLDFIRCSCPPQVVRQLCPPALGAFSPPANPPCQPAPSNPCPNFRPTSRVMPPTQHGVARPSEARAPLGQGCGLTVATLDFTIVRIQRLLSPAFPPLLFAFCSLPFLLSGKSFLFSRCCLRS